MASPRLSSCRVMLLVSANKQVYATFHRSLTTCYHDLKVQCKIPHVHSFICRYTTKDLGYFKKAGIPGPKAYPVIGTMGSMYGQVGS